MNGFINLHRFDKRRSDRWAVSPKHLWSNLLGYLPSEAQENLMVEFLKQNRTQDIVEERASQLLEELEIEYPNNIKLFHIAPNEPIRNENLDAMFVRGKMCDWVIIDNQFKSNIQRVSTYLYIDDAVELSRGGRDNMQFAGGQLIGPICIDNIHRNSSKGDQFAARAMALLNDKMTVAMVNTIKSYIPKEILEGKKECRINDNYKW